MADEPFSPDGFTSAVSAITSAFGDPTRRRIYLLAHESAEGITASVVAERLGLHANVARHHLDKLAAGGYLEVHTGKATGTAGRPSKRYVATATPVSIDRPVRRDDLVLSLLGRALELLPRPQAEAMAEEVGIEYGRQMASSLSGGDGDSQRSFRSALHAVADALTAHGFAAHTEARGDVVSIVAEHCPFGGAAVVSPVICAVDRGMVKGMLAALYGDTCPETERSRALGDDTCVTGVRVSLSVARHYLDHASTSPARPEAIEAMLPWFGTAADPGRVHTEGHAARVAVESAREQVASFFGCRGSREVVFTSGATESIATATWMATERGSHIVVPAVEHSAVREASARFDVATVPVDRAGRVGVDDVISCVRDDTALVHVQWGNHEVGTLQPVREIVAACRARSRPPLVHVDAAAAAGHVPISFRDLDADLVSVSAHKLGGPPGVGALLVRRGLRLRPLLVGGDQERARRAGFENVPGIVGFGAACDAVRFDGSEARLVQRVVDGIGLELLGDPSPSGRLPHLACFAIEGVEAEPVLLGLDQAGVAVHSGSSCSSEALEPSPVLEAMGVDASRSLRVSVGWSSTDADVDALLAALPPALARLRALGGAAG